MTLLMDPFKFFSKYVKDDLELSVDLFRFVGLCIKTPT